MRSPEGRRHLPLRAWLLMHLDQRSMSGAEWVDRNQLVFRLPWLHGSSKGWTRNDNRMYLEWAKHTGKHDLNQATNPKKWKANFRCAINSLKDIQEHREETQRKGREACRGYQFTDRRKVQNAYKILRQKGCDQDVPPLSPPASPPAACVPSSPLSPTALPTVLPDEDPRPAYFHRASGPEAEVDYDSDTTATSSLDNESTCFLGEYEEYRDIIHSDGTLSSNEDEIAARYIEDEEMLLTTPLSEHVTSRASTVTMEMMPVFADCFPTSLLLEHSELNDAYLTSFTANLGMPIGCNMEIESEQ